MADPERSLTDLMEEVMEEEGDSGLNPESDLSWEHYDDLTPDFESDYHE